MPQYKFGTSSTAGTIYVQYQPVQLGANVHKAIPSVLEVPELVVRSSWLFRVQDHVRPRALSLPVHVQDVAVHTTLDVVERTTTRPVSDEQPGRHFVRCITPTFTIENLVYVYLQFTVPDV